MAYRDFGWALAMLRAGKLVTRAGWNGKGMWLGLHKPDAGSANTLPYIYIMLGACNDRVPWVASQTDMLAEDFETVD